MVFLQILLAMAIVIALIALYFWWRFRSYFKAASVDYQMAQKLRANFYHDARADLLPCQDVDTGLNTAWLAWQALGFSKLADMNSRLGGAGFYRLAARQADCLALVLHTGYDAAGAVTNRFTIFAFAQEKYLFALSSGRGKALQTPSMDWQESDQINPTAAVQTLLKMCAGRSLLNPDLRMVKTVYERAHAARSDSELAIAPTRAAVEASATKLHSSVVSPDRRDLSAVPPDRRDLSASSAQIEQAYEMDRSAWLEQLELALLDHFRRESKLDAVEWERVRDHLHIVHSELDREELRQMLDLDEEHHPLFDSLAGEQSKPKLSPLLIYERVNATRPAVHQRVLLGSVNRPIEAHIYALPEAPKHDVVASNGYLMSGVDEDGQIQRGMVQASNVADVRRQARAQGLEEIKVLSEPMPLGVEIPTEHAAFVAQVLTEPVWRTSCKILANQWLLWAPPLIWALISVFGSRPYGWGDWFGFGYLTLALLLCLALLVPTVAYTQLLNARLTGKLATARFWLAVCRRGNFVGMIKSTTWVAEEAKFMAAEGRYPQALALWKSQQAEVGPEEYLEMRAAIDDSAGDLQAMAQSQREAFAISSKPLFSGIDLALTLLRINDPDQQAQAQALIAKATPDELSELGLAGYHFAQGLLAQNCSQHTSAIQQFQLAVATASQYSNPMAKAFGAEIQGHLALSLMSTGKRSAAEQLWQQSFQILKHAKSCQLLVRRYEQARQS
jgi:hypothetical protein